MPNYEEDLFGWLRRNHIAVFRLPSLGHVQPQERAIIVPGLSSRLLQSSEPSPQGKIQGTGECRRPRRQGMQCVRRSEPAGAHGKQAVKPQFPCRNEFVRSYCAAGRQGPSSPRGQKTAFPAPYIETAADRPAPSGSQSWPPPRRCAARRR